MAITINLQPQRLQTTYNPIVIVATSSQQSQDGFLMVGDIYVGGTYVTRMKVATNPDGFCLFDIHKHVENRLSYDFNPNLRGWAPATQSQATYSVLLGEEWRPTWGFVDNYFLPGGVLGFIGAQNDDPTPEFQVGNSILVEQTAPFTYSQYNGQTTITAIYATNSAVGYPGNRWIIATTKGFIGSTPPNAGTISLFGFQTYIATNVANVGNTIVAVNQKRAFNGVNTYLEDINWNYLEYTCGTWSGGTGKFLTNAPDHYKLGTQSRMWLHVHQDNANDASKLVMETNKGTFSFTNSFQTPLLTNYHAVLQVGCGPYQIISNTSSITAFAGSTFPIIDSNTTEITYFVEDGSGNVSIAPKTFKIDNLCSRYEKIQLVFMDKLGSMIPFIFNFASRENKTITRSNYQQHYGQYAPASQNWTYNTWDRGKKSLDTQVTEVWTVTSDWVNQSTSDFLMTLMESPEVYWIKEDGTSIAVSLTVAGTERKQTINEQVINYTITFEISQKNNLQRG